MQHFVQTGPRIDGCWYRDALSKNKRTGAVNVRFLAKGRAASVFLTGQHDLNGYFKRYVARKRILFKPESSEKPESSTRRRDRAIKTVQREIAFMDLLDYHHVPYVVPRPLAQVWHPNCRYFDAEASCDLYLEYYQDGDLFEYVSKKGALPETSARRIFCNLLDLVCQLDSLGIRHRDIRLENLLLVPREETLICFKLYEVVSPFLAQAEDDNEELARQKVKAMMLGKTKTKTKPKSSTTFQVLSCEDVILLCMSYLEVDRSDDPFPYDVVLADFGYACYTHETCYHATHEIGGSLTTLSPEQVNNMNAEYDDPKRKEINQLSNEIYALVVMLGVAVTQNPIYKFGEDQIPELRRFLESQKRFEACINHFVNEKTHYQLSDQLADFIRKCLRYKVEDRLTVEQMWAHPWMMQPEKEVD